MQPSRIAQDLMASGMDPSIHLNIAQASLCVLHRTVNHLSTLQKEHDELLPVLQQGYDFHSLEKYKKLLKDIHGMEVNIRNAPRTIAELDVDITILTRHLREVKLNSYHKSLSTQEEKLVTGDKEEQRRTSV
ncbi:MAG: hypothetical protein Q9213_008334 [Squamulea squamosa]